MTDPTKNLPWRAEQSPHGGWKVVDSAGALVHFVNGGGPNERTLAEAEALARMVAAGSVAGELYAAILNYSIYAQARGSAPFGATAEESATLTKAAPLLEPKE